ncbi:MAG: PQQ-binding-like beta-propeller repeat protein [Planctomycetota bacterium]
MPARANDVPAETPVHAAPILSAADANVADAKADSTTRTAEYRTPAQVLEAGGDWPQWAGTRLRNNTPNVANLPRVWEPGSFDRKTGAWDPSGAKNIRWVAQLGSQTYGNPVIADGRVYVGTNNGAGYLKRYPATVDLGCLLSFDEDTGKFMWQHSSEKLPSGRVHDWPLQGICCAPLVEGDRLWFVTSRGEVRCLDVNGFYDDQDDGVPGAVARVADLPNKGDAATYEAAIAGLLKGELTEAVKTLLDKHGEPVTGDVTIKTLSDARVWQLTGVFNGIQRTLTARVADSRLSFYKTISVEDKNEADVIWVYDMMGPEMGISQHNMCSCSVTSFGDLLFVHTANGVDDTEFNIPAPDAPSFVCMDKNTGKVLWTDNSPGQNILHGQWSSPAVAELGGVPQALFTGGDGWLYSFRADAGVSGKPELLWKFDCNAKTSKWVVGGAGTRNSLIGTPVVYDGLVYIAVGQDPEHGEGDGHLWCIDPTKRGDVSPTLAVKTVDGENKPIPHRRLQAVIEADGEAEIKNPNSAAVWHYSKLDQNGDGEIDFEEEMHRSLGSVAIKDDLLYVSDYSGLVHCLDAKGSEDGQPIVHWTYDMFAQSWGSPLIADGLVFFGDADGDVAVFEFGKENSEPIEEINMGGSSVYSTPVAANNRLFISTKDKLFCIEKQD